MSPIKQELRTSDIWQALKKVKHFVGVFPADRIPEVKEIPASFVVNTDRHDEPGTHWVAIILKPGQKVVYFDPLGFPPLQPQIHDYVTQVGRNGIKYNSVTLQNPDGVACGYYTVSFIKWFSAGKSLSQFVRFFRGRVGEELDANDTKLASLLV